MFKNILCVSDMTDTEELVIQEAVRRVRRNKGRIRFLYVLPIPDTSSVLFPQRHEQILGQQSRLVSEATSRLENRVKAIAGAVNVEFTTLVEIGEPDAVVVRAAEEVGCDLIMLSGDRSVDRIVGHVHCPVLVVRDPTGSDCILAATDFSDSSFPALVAASEEAKADGRRLYALLSLDVTPHMMTAPEDALPNHLPQDVVAEILRAGGQRLRQALEQVHVSDAVPLVRLGRPADSILSTIAELNCSLLVIGTIGRSDLSSLLLGSVAEAVISQARCSALIVRLSVAPQT